MHDDLLMSAEALTSTKDTDNIPGDRLKCPTKCNSVKKTLLTEKQTKNCLHSIGCKKRYLSAFSTRRVVENPIFKKKALKAHTTNKRMYYSSQMWFKLSRNKFCFAWHIGFEVHLCFSRGKQAFRPLQQNPFRI